MNRNRCKYELEHACDCCCVDCITSVPDKPEVKACKLCGDCKARRVNARLANLKWKNLEHFVPTTSAYKKPASGDCRKRMCKRVCFCEPSSSSTVCNRILGDLLGKIASIIIKCDAFSPGDIATKLEESKKLINVPVADCFYEELTGHENTTNVSKCEPKVIKSDFSICSGDSWDEDVIKRKESHTSDCCCIDCITR